MNKILLSAAVLLLWACGGNSNTSTPEEEPPLSEYELEQLKKDSVLALPPQVMTLEQAIADTIAEWPHQVTVSGYLKLPSSSYSNKTQSMNLFARPYQTEGFSLNVKLAVGDSNNAMKPLPRVYANKDVVIQDRNGTSVGLYDQVTLTGVVETHNSSWGDSSYAYAIMTVHTIEKGSNEVFDYSTLDWPVLNQAATEVKANYNKAFIAKGTLSFPMILSNTGGSYGLRVKTPKGEEFRIEILEGTGNNQTKPVESEWTPETIDILDWEGNRINPKKPVTLYGVLDEYGLTVEAITQ